MPLFLGQTTVHTVIKSNQYKHKWFIYNLSYNMISIESNVLILWTDVLFSKLGVKYNVCNDTPYHRTSTERRRACVSPTRGYEPSPPPCVSPCRTHTRAVLCVVCCVSPCAALAVCSMCSPRRGAAASTSWHADPLTLGEFLVIHNYYCDLSITTVPKRVIYV